MSSEEMEKLMFNLRSEALPDLAAEAALAVPAGDEAVLLCRYIGTNKYMGSRFWAECDPDEPRRTDYEYRWLVVQPSECAVAGAPNNRW